MAFEKVQISSKFYPEISSIGESSDFVDFTQEEIVSDDYSRVGLKSIKLPATVVDGTTTDEAGKVALINATKVAAVEYLETVFTNQDNQHDVKIYIASVERKSENESTVAESTSSNYVPKVDVFNVEVNFNVHVVPVALLIDSVSITKLDSVNFELKVDISNDLIGIVSSIDVIFDDFNGNPEPTPVEVTLPLSTPNVAGSKSFLDQTITFDDTVAAVGGEYKLLIELKDAQGLSLKAIEQEVLVQGI
jgi:hypothetical protein